MNRLRALAPAVGIVAFVALWEAFVQLRHVRKFVLAAPSDIVRYLAKAPDDFVSASWVTAQHALVGFLASLVVAVIIAAPLAAWELLEHAVAAGAGAGAGRAVRRLHLVGRAVAGVGRSARTVHGRAGVPTGVRVRRSRRHAQRRPCEPRAVRVGRRLAMAGAVAPAAAIRDAVAVHHRSLQPRSRAGGVATSSRAPTSPTRASA